MLDELVGDIGQCGVLDHRRRVQHPAHRKPGGGRCGHQPLRGAGFGDVAALHHDIGTDRADALDGLQRLESWLRARGQHDTPAASRGHLLGQKQPQAPQPAGDDVGTVAAEDRDLCRRHHHAAAPGVRDIEHEFAGVLGAAHHPNRGGGVGQRVVRALRHRQRAVRGELVHRAQQLPEPVGDG